MQGVRKERNKGGKQKTWMKQQKEIGKEREEQNKMSNVRYKKCKGKQEKQTFALILYTKIF